MKLIGHIGRHLLKMGGQLHVHGLEFMTLELSHAFVGLIVDLVKAHEAMLGVLKVGKEEAVSLIHIRFSRPQGELWSLRVVVNEVVI